MLPAVSTVANAIVKQQSSRVANARATYLCTSQGSLSRKMICIVNLDERSERCVSSHIFWSYQNDHTFI